MAQIYGAYQANKIQMGREVTAGTAVAAAHIWRGAFASLEDARTRENVEEQVGLIVNTERSYTSQYLARLSMPSTPLTFDQVIHLLEAGVATDATPVDNTGSYTWEYAMSTSNTPNTIKTYTIEAYNTVSDDDYREMEYSFVEEFTFDYSPGAAWMMSANWVGRQLSTGTPTSLSTLISDPDVAIGARTKLYIDATAGTVGTTQKTGVLMGASMTVNTGWQIVPVGDGSLYFAAIKSTQPEITFSITFELEETDGTSAVATERAIYESDAVRLFRLEIDGSDANHEMIIDWAGKYDSISSYENSDGNTTVTFEGHGVYSSTDSLYWTADVTNEIDALT